MKINHLISAGCGILLLILCTSCAGKDETVDMAALNGAEEITIPAVAEKPGAKAGVTTDTEEGQDVDMESASGAEAKALLATSGQGGEDLIVADSEEYDEDVMASQPDLPPINRPSARRIPVDYRRFGYMSEAATPMGTDALLSEISKDVAGKIYYQLQDDDEEAQAKVAVVIAVPLADFKRETEFGRVISEYFMTDMADRGIQVTELRLGSEINILPQTGEFIMSRNIGELANNAPELDYVVVSTYSNTRKTLILQGRLVSLKNGVVKTSWRHTLPLNRELLGLFHTSEKPFTIAVRGLGR